MGERNKQLLKWAVVLIAVFVFVQFARVYVASTQLKSIMSAESLDARRQNYSEETLLNLIDARLLRDDVGLPVDRKGDFALEWTVDGIDAPEEDLVIRAYYTTVVNLLVTKVPMEMTVEGRADAP